MEPGGNGKVLVPAGCWSNWAYSSSSAQCHPVLHEEGWTVVTCHSNTTDPGHVQHRLLLPVPPQKQKCKQGRGISMALGTPAVKAKSGWPWAHSPLEHSTKSLELALEAIQLCLCRAASEWGSWEQPKIPKSTSWRSQAGCVHPGHTIHHSYQRPTAESKLPARSCSH